MDIQFIKASPTQNVTILVLTQVPRAIQPEIAAQLLRYDGVGGEQVGFIEESKSARLRLQMMGGEFCGNASMAAGAYLALREKLPSGANAEYPIEVSGVEGIVRVGIARTGKTFRGRVNMPGAERIHRIDLNADSGGISADAVFLPGIVHLILPKKSGITLEEIERRICDWNGQIHADALGALIYDECAQSIEPVVYVPASNTIVRERGCGSGTAAIGCLNAAQNGAFAANICQPGGEIKVIAQMIGGKFSVQIEGNVSIVASGTAYL